MLPPRGRENAVAEIKGLVVKGHYMGAVCNFIGFILDNKGATLGKRNVICVKQYYLK